MSDGPQPSREPFLSLLRRWYHELAEESREVGREADRDAGRQGDRDAGRD